MRFVVPDLDDPNAHPRAVRKAVGHRRQAVIQAARDHQERLRPLLPPALQQLRETDLHDGTIQALRIDPAQQTMRLRLHCGDLQRGYFGLCLDYKDISLTPQEISLLCLISHEKSAEIYWQEIDLNTTADPPQFIHRLLWQTGIETGREVYAKDSLTGEDLYQRFMLSPEVELRFGSLALEITPREPNWPFSPCEEITVVRDPASIEGMEDAGGWTGIT